MIDRFDNAARVFGFPYPWMTARLAAEAAAVAAVAVTLDAGVAMPPPLFVTVRKLHSQPVLSQENQYCVFLRRQNSMSIAW